MKASAIEPNNGRAGVGRNGVAKKISPGEPEGLPELSAGSSDSEELPDPTRGT